MKRIVVALILVVLLSANIACATPDGFVSIFNGKNLDGWIIAGKPEGFTVVDGCMYSEGGKGGDSIRTEKMYGNYILRLEWMLSKTGNSGVFIRTGVPSPGFMEAQLLAPWTPYRDDLHCTGSIYGHVPANPRPDETTLRWRTIEISAAWKTITVKIDGVKTAEAHYDKIATMKDFPLAGYPGMQDSHTGPGEWVKFRNIEIKDLDQDPLFLTKGFVSSDARIRRAAYDAAVRLGPPMVDSLLDLCNHRKVEYVHTAQMALDRITGQASAPGTEKQAEQIREVLIRRLESSGNNGGKVSAAKLLGLIGKDDNPTISALIKTYRDGGPASEVALKSLKMIGGPRVEKELGKARKVK